MNSIVQRWTHPTLEPSGHGILDRVIDSGQWSYGPVAHQMERELAYRVNVENALLTNSGTSALWLVLTGIRKRDERQAVVVPAFGYSAAANVAAALGFDLYVADSMPDSPIVDPASVARLIDKHVAAVIGINYFGYSVSWDEIRQSDAYCVVEDAAGSYGAQYKERPCGSNADVAIFSFHTSKAVAAGGEGGAVVTNSAQLIERARSAARSGHTTGYYYSDKTGMNMLMSDVAASFLQDTIRRFGDMPELRRRAIDAIDGVLTSVGLPVAPFNHSEKKRAQNYQAYTMLTENRDLVLRLLRLDGFEARPCWPYLISELPGMQWAVKRIDGDLRQAKYFADHIINIPVNPFTPRNQETRFEAVIRGLSAQGLLTNTLPEQKFVALAHAEQFPEESLPVHNT